MQPRRGAGRVGFRPARNAPPARARLLHFKDSPTENCGDVEQLIARHIERGMTRIRELKSLAADLRLLHRSCSDGRAACDCGILGSLEQAARESFSTATRLETRPRA